MGWGSEESWLAAWGSEESWPEVQMSPQGTAGHKPGPQTVPAHHWWSLELAAKCSVKAGQRVSVP